MAVGEGCSRMALWTVWCITGYCSVRQPRHPTVRVWPLELLTFGPPDSSVVHRTGPVHCPVRHLCLLWLLRAQSVQCSVVSRPLNLTVALATVAPLGTLDSPVLHQTVWWIIAEWLPKFPKVASLELISLVHRTVRCARPGLPSIVFCSFYLKPFLDFLLVCVEPLAPVELII
jgi:hypothetical protein